MFFDNVDIVGIMVDLSEHIISFYDTNHVSMCYVGLEQLLRMVCRVWDALVLNMFHGIFG